MDNITIKKEIEFIETFSTNLFTEIDRYKASRQVIEKKIDKQLLLLSNEEKALKAKYDNRVKEFNDKINAQKATYQKQISKQDYIKDVIKNTASNYRSVLIYLIIIAVLSLFLVMLIIPIVTLVASVYTIYHLVKELNEISYISSERSCMNHRLRPEVKFIYKLFNKPTIDELALAEKSIYQRNIQSQYDVIFKKLEAEQKIEFNNISIEQTIELSKISKQVEELYLEKKKESQILDAEYNEIINDLKENLKNTVNNLSTIHQISNGSEQFLDIDGKFKFSDRLYSCDYFYYNEIKLEDPNLPFEFSIPQYKNFGVSSNLMIRDCSDKEKLMNAVNEIVLKQLFGIKPSKLKIKMFDPIELGAFFNSFHNINKEISEGAIYTTLNQLEEILDSYLRQAEKVIQNMLTNKYANLTEFNLANPELAEPYQLFVINDFPQYFNDINLKKLNQIMVSGPKCGIYIILVNDSKDINKNLNRNSYVQINPNEIQPVFSCLNTNDLIAQFNEEVNKAGNVLISFDQILANKDKWWIESASKSVEIPLGKRGKDLQFLQFDNMDNNQALMIGKPGSGKSNLLHVIIISALTKYSPDELEMYLVDFKGGVEFSVYAEFHIPHLRTVALESDREFGLSVIDGVEKELLRREKLFSSTGVQNIEQYNSMFPENKVPRIIFIVDEFQEFFNVDDNIKIEVSQKYDRIIRKGRAFGVNSLFSSQTLEGNSMSRSTRELIDIRIALMCGENDVRTIFDDKNLAAKDLSRPGEAIYNSENGKLHGNQAFQAVFVERSKIIEVVENIATFSLVEKTKRSKFIFRGSEKALITKENHPVLTGLDKFRTVRICIGEPISMDSDVFFDFKLSQGQNLIVFSDDNDAARVFSVVKYCLEKQIDKISRLYLVNSLSETDISYGNFENAYGDISGFGVYKNSGLKDLIQELGNELESRRQNESQQRPVFVFMNSMQRLRNLRAENDTELVCYILDKLLCDGPEFGIYFIMHFESLVSLKRTSLRISNFVHRIAFQMNSDALYEINGSYKNAPLKENRAMYYNDETGISIIYKPYELNNNQIIQP